MCLRGGSGTWEDCRFYQAELQGDCRKAISAARLFPRGVLRPHPTGLTHDGDDLARCDF